MTFEPPDVIVAAPPPSIAQAKAPPLPSSTLLVSVALAGAPKVATRMPEAVPAGAMLPVKVELVTVKLAIGMEDATTVPGGRRVTAERAVDDVGIAQRAQAAGDIDGRNVAADRAAGDVDRAVEEAIDPTRRLVEADVVGHRAVVEVQGRPVTVVDPTATELEVGGSGAGFGVVGYCHMVKVQRRRSSGCHRLVVRQHRWRWSGRSC